MKATDFNLERDIKYDLSQGLTTFGSLRLLIFEAGSIGLLRQTLLEELGPEKARELFFKFGFQHGYSDIMQMKMNYTFDSEIDLLASGPVIHTWEGLVQATPTKIEIDRTTGKFDFTGVWTNSYEAEQYLCYNEHSHEPVCWSLTGYASGWCTGFWGSPILALEPTCVGKGDAHCGWDLRPPEAHGAAGEPFAKLISKILGGV